MNENRIQIGRNVPPIGTAELFGGRTLSEIASDIAAEGAQETFGYAEAQVFGADDVGGLIRSGRDRRVQAILDAAGIRDEEAFHDLVRERTSDKWAYLGLDGVEGRILARSYPDLWSRE